MCNVVFVESEIKMIMNIPMKLMTLIIATLRTIITAMQ